MGWSEIELTKEGRADRLLGHFEEKERVFQMHGDTFDVPSGATHLAHSKICSSQAFRYGEKAYGLQFHLEVDQAMIDRFLRVPANREEVEQFGGKEAIARMETETSLYLERSLRLSRKTFLEFARFFAGGLRDRQGRSAHGKPR